MSKKKLFLYVVGHAAFFAGIVGMFYSSYKKQYENAILQEERAKKNASVIRTFNLWMQSKQEGKSVCTFLENNNFHEVAIYGMNHVGQRLLDELEGSGITVKYAIDVNADNIHTRIKVVRPDEKLEQVDAIVVTPVFYYDEIERMLVSRVSYPVVSMEEIIEYS